jgi:hypothetical protein
MKRIKKNKNQVIVVPTTQKSTIPKTVPKSKSVKNLKTKTLTKPRSVQVKENTLAYYNCLIDQVANPLNEKVKITQLCHDCKCNKKEVVQAQQEHKQELVQKLAQSYKTFGENLGHYLHADILGCAKKLKKK